ncbi:MAG: GTPase, partial [Gammaproteobacteria bacterium]
MLQQTTFIKSAAAWKDLPPEGGKEVAFWGRSNVGKSSTLNALC